MVPRSQEGRKGNSYQLRIMLSNYRSSSSFPISMPFLDGCERAEGAPWQVQAMLEVERIAELAFHAPLPHPTSRNYCSFDDDFPTISFRTGMTPFSNQLT